MKQKTTKKVFLVIALAVIVAFATMTPAMAAPAVPTELTLLGNSWAAKPGSYLNCDRLLFAATGKVTDKKSEVTRTELLVNKEGLVFWADGTNADDTPNWEPLMDSNTPPAQVRLDLRTVEVRVVKPAISVNGNFTANALRAFALPGGSQFLLTPTGDSKIDNLVIAATNKYFGDIQNALNGSAQNIDPAVARAMSEVVKNNAPMAIQIIRMVGILAGLTDQQTAALIRIQKDPVIESYVDYNDKAKATGYIMGRNTYNQHLVAEKAKSDKPIVGNIYVAISGGAIKLSPSDGLVINPNFEPAIKADAAGKWYLEVRTLDNKTLHGELIGSFAGETFTGTAWLSEMNDIAGPTITVRQAATFKFPNLSAPGVLKGAIGMGEFMAQAAGSPVPQ